MSRRTDADGVSSVLGAILVFALLVVTLVTLQVRFVPRWEEEREGRHMDTLAEQLTQFKADSERLATNATVGGILDPLTAEPSSGGFRFLRPTGAAQSDVSFEPSAAGAGLVLSSPLLRVQVRDGQELFGIGEDWEIVPASGTLTDIQALRHLRLRVNMEEDVCDDYAFGDTATLVVRDAGGDEVARAVTSWLPASSSEWALRLDIYGNFDGGATANDQVSSATEFFFQQLCQGVQENYLDYHYFDLLDPELLFEDLVAGADKPIRLDLGTAGLVADYTVVFTDTTGGSGGSGTGGGLLLPNYSNTMPSGVLRVEPGYQRLPDQTLVLEHGAILVVQDDGAAMAVPPTLSVRLSAQQLSLDLVVPSLTGNEQSIGGQRTVFLQASSAAGSRLDAVASRLSLVLPTAYPAVWEAHLRDTLELAGLDDAGPTPQFTLTATASSVQLDLFGPASAPSDATEDVFLRLQQASIDVDLRPSG